MSFYGIRRDVHLDRYLVPAQMGGQIVEYLPFPLSERLDHAGGSVGCGRGHEPLRLADQMGHVAVGTGRGDRTEQWQGLRCFFEEWPDVMLRPSGCHRQTQCVCGTLPVALLHFGARNQYQPSDLSGGASGWDRAEPGEDAVGAPGTQVQAGKCLTGNITGTTGPDDEQGAVKIVQVDPRGDIDLIELSEQVVRWRASSLRPAAGDQCD